MHSQEVLIPTRTLLRSSSPLLSSLGGVLDCRSGARSDLCQTLIELQSGADELQVGNGLVYVLACLLQGVGWGAFGTPEARKPREMQGAEIVVAWAFGCWSFRGWVERTVVEY